MPKCTECNQHFDSDQGLRVHISRKHKKLSKLLIQQNNLKRAINTRPSTNQVLGLRYFLGHRAFLKYRLIFFMIFQKIKKIFDSCLNEKFRICDIHYKACILTPKYSSLKNVDDIKRLEIINKIKIQLNQYRNTDNSDLGESNNLNNNQDKTSVEIESEFACFEDNIHGGCETSNELDIFSTQKFQKAD